ncbi:MAG: hypothetical protein LAP61_07870 [Acidobacteriia bacterium]|nr:hypothetical protein [Terriglobia bacterium]
MATKKFDFKREAANLPKDPAALKLLEHYVELGQVGAVEAAGIPSEPRYLVTYMNSQTGGAIRSATVVSITNQSRVTNRVFVSFFRGFQDNTAPVGVAAFSIPPDFTVDFSSRNLPGEITVVNAVPSPELVFDEGRAIVSSTQPEIGVSARVIYTGGDKDNQLLAITDSKVVLFGKYNMGD